MRSTEAKAVATGTEPSPPLHHDALLDSVCAEEDALHDALLEVHVLSGAKADTVPVPSGDALKPTHRNLGVTSTRPTTSLGGPMSTKTVKEPANGHKHAPPPTTKPTRVADSRPSQAVMPVPRSESERIQLLEEALRQEDQLDEALIETVLAAA